MGKTKNLAPLYAGTVCLRGRFVAAVVGSFKAKERRQSDKALQRYCDWSEQASRGEYARKIALVAMHEGEGMCTEVRMRPGL